MNIFDLLYEDFKLDKDKPINLFEAFAGIGTQTMALKRLGLKVNHVGISEIDRHAIKSYEAIHGKVKNYGGIGSFEKFPPNIDICTWSFPCQDISLAGKQRGMVDGSRSNYGYVFLDTIENTPYEERPKVLLMENVKALLSETFSEDWKEINLRLERLGYKNYADSLIATDYGVPQTRDRVFIVSIKGDYNYNFPKKVELERFLELFLEENVDEKYYLTEKQIEQIANWNAFQKPLENAKSKFDETIQTITAKSNQTLNASMVLINEYDEGQLFDYKSSEKFKRHIENNGTVPTLRTEMHIAILEKFNKKVRKLTPLEAWRLMGIKDEDFYKAKNAGISDSQLYKQAGNAIVVDVLMAIFKEILRGEHYVGTK